MPYQSKTNWKHDDVVTEQDLNRIEGGVEESHQRLDAMTPGQIGAETLEGAQAKVDAHANKTSAAHKAGAISIEDAGGHFVATDVEGALAEVFTHGVDGKAQVATAISAKGGTVPGSSPHSFAELAAGVGSIVTGKRWASGTSTSPGNTAFTVTGLTFRPSVVIVSWSSVGARSYGTKVYRSDFRRTDAGGVYMENAGVRCEATSYGFGMNSGSPFWTITTNGFSVNPDNGYGGDNISVNWIAYE